MRYLVCYDIADDRRRDRLAGALLDFGPRLQESVFLLDLDEELLVRLKERVTKVVDESVDLVHVFAMCGACEGKIWGLGPRKVPKDQEYYLY